jgi:hypothetical protein
MHSDEEDATQNAPKAAQRKTAPKDKSTEDVEDIVAGLFDDIIDPMDGQPTSAMDAVLAKGGNTANNVSNDSNRNKEASGTRKAASPNPDDDQDGKSKPKRTIAKVDEQRYVKLFLTPTHLIGSFLVFLVNVGYQPSSRRQGRSSPKERDTK